MEAICASAIATLYSLLLFLLLTMTMITTNDCLSAWVQTSATHTGRGTQARIQTMIRRARTGHGLVQTLSAVCITVAETKPRSTTAASR